MEKAQIRIIRSKRKTVALEIRPDLSVLVRAPYWMADWQIRKFVDEKSDWLYAHLREMEQKQKLEAARPKAAPLNPDGFPVQRFFFCFGLFESVLFPFHFHFQQYM